MERPVVGQIAWRYSPIVGGVETHVREIGKAAVRYGHEVVTRRPFGTRSYESPRGEASIRRLGPPDLSNDPRFQSMPRALTFPMRLVGDAVRETSTRDYLRHRGFAILHFHAAAPSIVLSSLGRLFERSFSEVDLFDLVRSMPNVLSYHGRAEITAPGTRAASWERRSLLQYRWIICVDKHLHEFVSGLHSQYGIDSEIKFIPNMVDTDWFRPGGGQSGECLVVGFAARASAERGTVLIRRLVDSAPKGVRFRLALADVRRTDARAWARYSSSRPNVDIQFNLDPASMREFYLGIDMLFNPIQFGGMSRATLESMACGRPAAMIGVGDRWPVKHDETGFLLTTDQDPVEDLIALLGELVMDRERIRKVGRCARNLVVEEFSSKVIVPKIEEFYDLAISAA